MVGSEFGQGLPLSHQGAPCSDQVFQNGDNIAESSPLVSRTRVFVSSSSSLPRPAIFLCDLPSFELLRFVSAILPPS